MTTKPKYPAWFVLSQIARVWWLAAVLYGRQGLAQTAMDSTRVDSVRAALQAIPLQTPIRIETVGHSVIEGRLSARTDTGIVVHQRRDSVSASLARIASISRPARSLKSGTLVGALSGAVLGSLVVGTLASGLCDRADCSGAFADGATAGAVLGAGVGALIGAGIGAVKHHWEQIWP